MDYDFLPMSNGSGDVVVMPITVARSVAGTNITVSPHTNIPTKFIAATGTQLASGMLDPTKPIQIFKGHWTGSVIAIDAFEPGTTDAGNTTSEVVVFRPLTGWFNRAATFVRNITGFGAATVKLGASWDVTTTTGGTNIVSTGSSVRGAGNIFTHTKGTVDHVNFRLGNAATPVDTSAVVNVLIYAVTGKVGRQQPVGSPLAFSDSLTPTQISALTSPGVVTFTFSGVNRIVLDYATRYAVWVHFQSGTGQLRAFALGGVGAPPNRANIFTYSFIVTNIFSSIQDSSSAGLYCFEVYTTPNAVDSTTFGALTASNVVVQGNAAATKFIQPDATVLDGRTNSAYRYNVNSTDLSNCYAYVNIPHGLDYTPAVDAYFSVSSTAAPANPALPLTLRMPYKNIQSKSYSTKPASGYVFIASIDDTNIRVGLTIQDDDFFAVMSASHFLIFYFICSPRPKI